MCDMGSAAKGVRESVRVCARTRVCVQEWDAARRGQGGNVPFDEQLVDVHKPVRHLQSRMGGDEGRGGSTVSQSIY
jgi:hypothetical protein